MGSRHVDPADDIAVCSLELNKINGIVVNIARSVSIDLVVEVSADVNG